MTDVLPVVIAERSAAIRATVVIPLHNHEAYIGQLLESLFAQWQPGLELLLIDDASTDGGFAEVQRILGRHPEIPATVTRMGRSHGMGLPREIVRLARGTILIRADSDDIALPGRLTAILRCFDEDADCRLVTSNAALVSSEGVWCGLFDTRVPDEVFRDPIAAAAVEGNVRWLGATMAFHRDLYEQFPFFDPELCPYGLDLILPLRALILGSHHYLARPLVGWRQHGTNTHRIAGAHDRNATAQEHYQSLLLMALAQKVRDVEYSRTERPCETLDLALEQSRRVFDAKFDHWSRLRTRAMVEERVEGSRKTAAALMPAIAPIPTLQLGKPLRFGSEDSGSRFIARGTGFNEPEAWGAVWTERVAHLNVRFDADPSIVIRLIFKLHFSGLLSSQKFSIGVAGQAWSDFEWLYSDSGNCIDVSYILKNRTNIVGIIILVHETLIPKEVDLTSSDERTIGVGLLSLTAVAHHAPQGLA